MSTKRAIADTRCRVINIRHTGGDTLQMRVEMDAAWRAEREITAQVRRTKTDVHPLKSFRVVTDGDLVWLTLEGPEIQDLTLDGVFVGYWDAQIAERGTGFNAWTFGRGELELDPDVTRG